MNKILYLSVVITICLPAISSAESLQDEKVQAFGEALFSNSDQGTLDPSETKKLLWAYDTALLGRNDENSLVTRRQVRALLDATVINNSMCLRGVLVQLDRLAQSNALYPNILGYLRKQKKELFNICHGNFVHHLKQEARAFNREENKQLGLLRASITKANGGVEIGKPDFAIPKSALIEGVFLFLAKKLGKPKDKKKFHEEFEKHVGTLCGNVKRNLKSSIQIYEALVTDKDMVGRLDPFESGWIADVKVCNTILANINNVCSRVYDLWLQRGSKS